LWFCFIPGYLLKNEGDVRMPQSAWNAKEERQYENVKSSEENREGRPEKDAKRIAAATVNKERRKKGETKT
jgi:hypothetical protein